MRRTKIVCTLGPASSDQEQIDALVAAGMDCARLNFSHGEWENHRKTAELVRKASQKARRPLAILADLCGPKMRVGTFANGSIDLIDGESFTFTTEDVEGDEKRVSVSYEPLPRDVRVGDKILLDDGLLRLRVEEATATDVLCTVEVGGTLSDRKGLNLPGVELSTPALTDKDKADLRFAVDELKVDYLALSFVRTASDVQEAKDLAEGTPIIAKIEKPKAVENLDEIIGVADGLMVARGDLGVELGSEKVPLTQKRIIRQGNLHGKVVITATQMLDSMIRNPRPTRAEAADVANAVLDGTDAVMLSGETAVGKYPAQSVEMMGKIIREVEEDWSRGEAAGPTELLLADADDWQFPNAAARAAALLSKVLPLKAVVTFTRDGRSARLLSEYRPRAPVFAITSDQRVATRLALEWGICPRVEVPPEAAQEALRICTALLVREGACKKGDAFAMVVGWPPSGRTNTVKLHWL